MSSAVVVHGNDEIINHGNDSDANGFIVRQMPTDSCAGDYCSINSIKP